jgi:hypothetical protein
VSLGPTSLTALTLLINKWFAPTLMCCLAEAQSHRATGIWAGNSRTVRSKDLFSSYIDYLRCFVTHPSQIKWPRVCANQRFRPGHCLLGEDTGVQTMSSVSDGVSGENGDPQLQHKVPVTLQSVAGAAAPPGRQLKYWVLLHGGFHGSGPQVHLG